MYIFEANYKMSIHFCTQPTCGCEELAFIKKKKKKTCNHVSPTYFQQCFTQSTTNEKDPFSIYFAPTMFMKNCAVLLWLPRTTHYG